MTGVALFEWLSTTPVYRSIHSEAVALVPAASAGERWLDLGCGPGLITRAAASNGFEAVGIDASAAMVSTARRIAAAEGSHASFEVRGAAQIQSASADVISAASLLYVVPNRAAIAGAIWRALRPGGTALIVETTAAMTPVALTRIDRSDWTKEDHRAIGMWAYARRGRAIDPTSLEPFAGASATFHPLLSGLVGAWLFRLPE